MYIPQESEEEHIACVAFIQSIKPVAQAITQRVTHEILCENRRRFRSIRTRELEELKAYNCLPWYKQLFTARPIRTYWKHYKLGMRYELTNNCLLDAMAKVIHFPSSASEPYNESDYAFLKRMKGRIEELREVTQR